MTDAGASTRRRRGKSMAAGQQRVTDGGRRADVPSYAYMRQFVARTVRRHSQHCEI